MTFNNYANLSTLMLIIMGFCFVLFHFSNQNHNMNYIYLATLVGIILNSINLFSSILYLSNDITITENFKFYNLNQSSTFLIFITSLYFFPLLVDKTNFISQPKMIVQLQTHDYSFSEIISYIIFILCFITIIKIKKKKPRSA